MNPKFDKIARARSMRKIADEIDPLEVEKELREDKKGKTYMIDGKPFELGEDAVGSTDDADDDFVFGEEPEAE